MDKVRLGRVLGRATRLAARTAVEAVDAATAPDPRAGASPEARQAGTAQAAAGVAQRTAAASAAAAAQVGRRARDAGNRTVPALRRATRAVWLEVTGSFFALFALLFLFAAWRLRAYAWSAVAADHWRLAAMGAVGALFGWFAVSSFLAARRRG